MRFNGGSMRGFQSATAKQARANNYADGGVVSRVKEVLGFKPRPVPQPSEVTAVDEAPTQQPAKPPKKAISQYSAGTATQRRIQEAEDKALGFANGGPVRGPGTGTSDEISDEVPEGTYIMPADSTRQIGSQALAQMGKPSNMQDEPGEAGESGGDEHEGPAEQDGAAEEVGEAIVEGIGKEHIPVNLSNGEFKLPPAQVHAIGVQVLNAIKGATHTPVGFKPGASQRGGGEEQRAFFADGGLVEGEKKIPALASTSPSGLYMQDRAQEMQQQASAGNYAGAVGTAGRTAVQGLGMYSLEAADKVLSPWVNAGQRMVGGLLGTDTPQGNPVQAPQAPQTLAAPKPANVATSPGTAPGAIASPQQGQVQDTATLAPNTPSSDKSLVASVMPGVYRSGNSYSDSAAGAIAGAAPGGMPSAQNMVAAQALSDRSAQIAAHPTRGFSGVIGPSNTNGNMFARTPEQQRRDAEVQASSIHRQTAANGREALAALNEQSMQRERSASAMALEHAKQQGALALANANQQGAMERELVQQAGSSARDSARNVLLGRQIALDETVKGFDIRKGQQMESLRAKYEAAKTPQEQASIAKRLREINGASDPNRFTVVPGGQEWDAQAGTMRNVPGRIFNNQTGEFMDAQRPTQPQSSGPAQPKTKAEYDALPQGAQYIRNGVTYTKG